MEIVELILVWAIIVTITLGIIVTFLIRLRKKHLLSDNLTMIIHHNRIVDYENQSLTDLQSFYHR